MRRQRCAVAGDVEEQEMLGKGQKTRVVQPGDRQRVRRVGKADMPEFHKNGHSVTFNFMKKRLQMML